MNFEYSNKIKWCFKKYLVFSFHSNYKTGCMNFIDIKFIVILCKKKLKRALYY